MERKPFLLLLIVAGRETHRLIEALRKETCFRIETARSTEEAISSMEKDLPTMVFCESDHLEREDFKLLRTMRARWPLTPLMAASAVQDALRVVNAIGVYAARERVRPASVRPPTSDPAARIVGRSKAMAEILKLIGELGRSEIPVLITGETGTGKQLVAEAIHKASDRCSRDFVALNCARIPRELCEAELFGWTRGAFTGAARNQPGLLERASGSTLILDELQAMVLDHQGKLLVVMEDGLSRRVGGASDRKVDVRFIALTNKPPRWLIEQGLLREDFYYRLRGKEIRLPPLRERIEDVALLAEHFLRQLELKHRRGGDGDGVVRVTLAPDALSALEAHPWPGNVRELKQVLEGARVSAAASGRSERILREDLDFSDLALEERGGIAPDAGNGQDGLVYSVRGLNLDGVKQQVILKALAIGGGRVTVAARALGIHRTALWRWIHAHGLDARA